MLCIIWLKSIGLLWVSIRGIYNMSIISAFFMREMDTEMNQEKSMCLKLQTMKRTIAD